MGNNQTSLIVSAIEELGEAMRLFGSTWYVRSELTAAETAARSFISHRWRADAEEAVPLHAAEPTQPQSCASVG